MAVWQWRAQLLQSQGDIWWLEAKQRSKTTTTLKERVVNRGALLNDRVQTEKRRSENGASVKRMSNEWRRGRRGSGETRCLFHTLMLHQWMWLSARHSPSLFGFSDTPGKKSLMSGFYLQHLSAALRQHNTNRVSVEQGTQDRSKCICQPVCMWAAVAVCNK